MTSENGTTTTATVEEAIDALAHLGVTGSARIGTAHDPDVILGWCQWAEDRRRSGQQVGTGLIVRNIRSGEQPPKRNHASSASASAAGRKLAERAARFRERALPFPPGSVCETHAAAELRRRSRHGGGEVDDLFPEDRATETPAPPDHRAVCEGDLVVVDRSGMVLAARCDRCREELSYPPLALAVLPQRPLALGRALPSPLAPVRPAGGWFRGEPDGLKKFDPDPAMIMGAVQPEAQQPAEAHA